MTTEFGKENLLKLRASKPALIGGHRGNFGGNVIQNTVLSCITAQKLGADVVEIDVTKSTDGVFFVFHTGAEKYVFGKKCNLAEMTSKQIEKLEPINGVGERVDQRVERFSYFLEHMKGKGYINVDRAWFEDWKGAIEMIREYDMEDQIILKCPVKRTLLRQLQQSGSKVMFMPIMTKPSEWDIVKEYDLNTVACELVFPEADSEVAQPSFIAKLHEDGMLVWVNTLRLVDYRSICGWFDDNKAIIEGYDSSWGVLLDRGFDVIQTDWPSLVRDYLETRK